MEEKLIYIYPWLKGQEIPTLFGPSERTILSQCSLEYWMVDKVQKPSNLEC
jgi:hypothetical protein